jgi:hypothetical protein
MLHYSDDFHGVRIHLNTAQVSMTRHSAMYTDLTQSVRKQPAVPPDAPPPLNTNNIVFSADAQLFTLSNKFYSDGWRKLLLERDCYGNEAQR